MHGEPYSVDLRSLSDSSCDVVFEITPPVEFITEEARRTFGSNVLHLVCRRVDDPAEVMNSGIVEVTHNTPHGRSSMGYAKIETLRYGQGVDIFTQALLTALNGESVDMYRSGDAPWKF